MRKPVDHNTTKLFVCSCCKASKSISEFDFMKREQRYTRRCRSCLNDQAKTRRKKHRPERLEASLRKKAQRERDLGLVEGARSVTRALVEKIDTLIQEGIPPKKISNILCIKYKTIKYVRAKYANMHKIPKNTVSEALKSRIKTMWYANNTALEIAMAVGISRNAVCGHLQRMKLFKKDREARKKWSTDEIKQLATLKRSQVNDTIISQIMERSPQGIKSAVSRYGLSPRIIAR